MKVAWSANRNPEKRTCINGHFVVNLHDLFTGIQTDINLMDQSRSIKKVKLSKSVSVSFKLHCIVSSFLPYFSEIQPQPPVST